MFNIITKAMEWNYIRLTYPRFMLIHTHYIQFIIYNPPKKIAKIMLLAFLSRYFILKFPSITIFCVYVLFFTDRIHIKMGRFVTHILNILKKRETKRAQIKKSVSLFGIS